MKQIESKVPLQLPEEKEESNGGKKEGL